MGRVLLRVAVGLTLFFLYFPLFVIFLYSFNAQRIQVWPIQEWTTSWYSEALANPDVRDAFVLSVEVAFFAMITALVESLDWLELREEGHRRALFGAGGPKWLQP